MINDYDNNFNNFNSNQSLIDYNSILISIKEKKTERILYVSDFTSEVINKLKQIEIKQEHKNTNAKIHTRYFYCISNGQISQTWNCNENDYIKNSPIEPFKNNTMHCDNIFSSLNFWGVNIVIFANIIYIIPYFIVVLIYYIIPDVKTRAYHKAVISYNVTQIILNIIIIAIGTCILCHISIHSNIYVILGLILMFLTISSTSWLFVICIDMTLVITRFRSTLPIDTNQQQERKKFLIYAICTWTSSLLPTVLACVADLTTLLPISSPIRPNFHRFNDGINLTAILYVTIFPALTCFANTILFLYTFYKMILIRKSTSFATENNGITKINEAKKQFIVYLKLYLLMDSPWITSGLAAAFNELWILKFFRMIQPMLMLLVILPPGTISKLFKCNYILPKWNWMNEDKEKMD